jgi:hypothetical protein
MTDFSNNKDDLNRELEQFISTLSTLLPRYSRLLKKKSLLPDEIKELGEIEHFLIEINGKITEIKNMLEHDLFGHSLDYYYQIKRLAKKGDFEAKLKLERLREAFNESLKGDTLVNWN